MTILLHPRLFCSIIDALSGISTPWKVLGMSLEKKHEVFRSYGKWIRSLHALQCSSEVLSWRLCCRKCSCSWARSLYWLLNKLWQHTFSVNCCLPHKDCFGQPPALLAQSLCPFRSCVASVDTAVSCYEPLANHGAVEIEAEESVTSRIELDVSTWCKCGHCVTMQSEIECYCCKESSLICDTVLSDTE